jgi:hypothetical protein
MYMAFRGGRLRWTTWENLISAWILTMCRMDRKKLLNKPWLFQGCGTKGKRKRTDAEKTEAPGGPETSG